MTKNMKYQKPQQEWKEVIAVYLYLAGMGAGAYVIGTLVDWFIDPSRVLFIRGVPFDWAKATLLWGPVLVAIGAPFLILDLGIKRRFLYASLNPKTSWVARGFLILSVFIVLGWLLLLKSVLPFEWLNPKSLFWRIAEVMAIAFALATALYTGILLKATKSVPLWNTYLLPLLFLVSALSTGSMAIILSVTGSGLFSMDSGASRILIGSEQILVVIEAAILSFFLAQAYKKAEQGKDSVRILLFGSMKFIFWGGIVLLGLIFPMVLELLASLFHGNKILIFAAGFFLLCGGFFLRLGVLYAGVKERHPMLRLMEMRYELGKTPKP